MASVDVMYILCECEQLVPEREYGNVEFLFQYLSAEGHHDDRDWSNYSSKLFSLKNVDSSFHQVQWVVTPRPGGWSQYSVAVVWVTRKAVTQYVFIRVMKYAVLAAQSSICTRSLEDSVKTTVTWADVLSEGSLETLLSLYQVSLMALLRQLV